MNTPPLRDGKLIAAFFAALIAAAFVFTPLRADKPDNSGNGNAGTTYSARAIAMRIDGTIDPPGPIIVCDTGPLPATGGLLTASKVGVNIFNGALTIDAVDAEAMGSGPGSSAEARLTNYYVDIVMGSMHVVITADYIFSEVNASANPSGKVRTDVSVAIHNLRVNGQPITITGQPNQVVDFPNIDTHLIINEQLNSGGTATADIAVTALHFRACDVQGHVGTVQAGITVNGKPPPPEGDCGKVTGGGWIAGTPSGEKGTFGMSGGIRRGEFWGHLTYVDHGTQMKVESGAVTNFQNDPASANGRIITYAVTINGAPGTATLRVVDNGEPGRNDIFDLSLSTGYHSSGDLGGSKPGGGNIQLHKCPPGWQ